MFFLRGPRLSLRDSMELRDGREYWAHCLLLALRTPPPHPHPHPRLIFGQEFCNELPVERGMLVPKVDGGGGQQFLKVLKSNLWVPIPIDWWPNHVKMLFIDDNHAKNVLNPRGTIIFPSVGKATWKTPSYRPSWLHIRKLVNHPNNSPILSYPTQLATGILANVVMYIRPS